MSKISATQSGPAILEWVEKNQTELENHQAWDSKILESDAEERLKNKPSFTYLLRKGDEKHLYFISFIKEDGSLKHQFFRLESSRGRWYYRNGGIGGAQDAISENLDELICMMMHCDANSCKPLISR